MTTWANGQRRIGLGCMRLSTEPDREDERSLAVIRAAYDAGVRIFDTARAYALDDGDLGHNERLLARALSSKAAGAPGSADGVAAGALRIVTKGGMRRPEGRWVPDGRARSIVADCKASVEALGGLPIDLYLLHAPDPDVAFAVSVRALASLLERGLVKNVGLSNVTRGQLDEALAVVPVAAVEMSLGWYDDKALKGGVVARCIERDITVIAHRPLGGAKKKRSLERDRTLRAVAERNAAGPAMHPATPPAQARMTPAQVALAAVLDLHESIVAIPGATSVETARSAAAADDVRFDDDDRALLAAKLDRGSVRGPPAPVELVDGEVVLLMGIQGAGKTDALSSFIERGYERINRDERGGTMRDLHRHLDERLRAGARRIVLDNTYVARSVRRAALEVAWRHRVAVRGVWFDTPLASAQVNVVLRMLAHHGRLLEPHEMGGGPAELPPFAQHRLLRTLEVPSLDEGWSALDMVPFVRRPSTARRRARFIALEALPARDPIGDHTGGPGGPGGDNAGVEATWAQLLGAREGDGCADDQELVLVFTWSPGRSSVAADVADRIRASAPDVEIHFAACGHAAGPATCWCRPPLPGLLLAFALAHDVDPARSVVVGTSAAHRALAAAVGAQFLDASRAR